MDLSDIIVHPLKDDEKRRLFNFTESLPIKDYWGKKGGYLRGDFKNFQKFFKYFKTFKFSCFLVAENKRKILGFIVAVYNPDWIHILEERYKRDLQKRAHILGLAVVNRNLEVLKFLTKEMFAYLTQEEIKEAEYPTFGGTCLTTASDVLVPEYVDALTWFREAGYKINECYYSMKLDLNKETHVKVKRKVDGLKFEDKKGCIEISKDHKIVGRITWDPIKNYTTSIGIQVKPAQRGKGFGTLLMKRGLDKLRSEGVRTVELGVDGNNIPALKLYRKFGFYVDKTFVYIIALAHDFRGENFGSQG